MQSQLRGFTVGCTVLAAISNLLAQPPVGAFEDLVTLSQNYRLLDLTHPFDDRTVYWPTESGFELLRGPAGRTEKGYYYSANRFAAPEHGGTHIDAPIHFYEGRQTVDRVPLGRLIGEAAVVDVTGKVRETRDYQISIDDLRGWEERYGRSLAGLIVLLHTGWARFWPDRARYLGTDKRGVEALGELHFPGLAPDAARWLVEQRAVKAVGIDTASIDFGPSDRFESHVTLFEHNVPVFENVADMSGLPPVGAIVIALPMKIAGGSGGPLRIIALIPRQP